MVMDRLMERMGSASNLSVKWSISIDTMLNYDGDQHRHGDGVNRPLVFLLNQASRSKRLAATPI